MPNGYAGKILRVDLSTKTTSIEEPSEDFYRCYLGGTGFISYFLLKEVKANVDPLGPANKLIFATGPLTGVPVSGTGRNSVGARSPLTGGQGNAEVGGFWGPELKFAGFDAIIVEGKAAEPVYIWIEDTKVEIRDASHLWGKPTKDVQDIIKKEHGAGTRVCQIGPAGENMVLQSCIVNDINHAAGRCGLGAVMGSKNLRAIAVRGHQKFPLADPDATTALIRRLIGEIKNNRGAQGMHSMGTAGGVVGFNTAGNLPTRNFSQAQFEGAEKITGAAINKTVLKRRGGCFACTVRCKPECEVGEPYNVIPEYGGPEYETVAALGSLCCIDNLLAVVKGNALCSAYGLDTIGTGSSIAFAMECFERGIISEKDTGGILLKFGNDEAMLQMIEMIAHRQGFGDILAEGAARAARKIGKGSEDFAMHVKGQEIPMHEPRLKMGLGIGYAISHTGADHVHNIHDTAYSMRIGSGMKAMGIFNTVPANDLGPAKIRMLVYGSMWQHLLDSFVFCNFVPLSSDNIIELMRVVTGWNTNLFELMKDAERYVTMARIFNIRNGLSKADDRLPKRFLEAFDSGPIKGVAPTEEQVNNAVETYYGMLGWDKDGVPTPAKIGELGIEQVVKV